jgi:aminoglycoside/choline kinase family phosphotransferase
LAAAGAIGANQRVESITAEPIGQGAGMMGAVTRLRFELGGAGPGRGSVIMKSRSTSDTNRAVADTFRLYEREVRFYSELAPQLVGLVPRCHAALHDATTGDFIIVLEDLADYRCGDQVVGCGVDDARAALDALAMVHARFWHASATSVPDWVPKVTQDPFRRSLIEATAASWPRAVELFGHLMASQVRDAIPDFIDALPAMFAHMGTGPQTLAHTDFRLDNLMFSTRAGRSPVVILDWSSAMVSKGTHDVAFLLSQNVHSELRRAHETELVAHYHRRLCAHGVTDYSAPQCWEDYRSTVLFELFYALVIGGALDVSDARATAFVSALVTRCATTIVDLDLLATLRR